MTRLIPGKTKVEVELFRGITLGDVFVAGIGVTMIVLVILSSLPHKFGVCIGVGAVAGLLLFRIDEQPNYRYILHILGHFGYDRHFAKTYTDKMLVERGEGRIGDAAFDELFRKETEKRETKAEKKERLKAMKAAEKEREKERKREDKLLKSKKISEEEKEAIRRKRAEEEEEERLAEAEEAEEVSDEESAKPLSKKEKKAEEKAKKAEKKRLEKERKLEDKILKSKKATEEEKEAIRARRAAESEAAMRRMAEAKDAAISRKNMDDIIGFTAIRNGLIEYAKGEYYGAAIEIDPVEFRFFSEHRRQNSIEGGLGRILRAVNAKYSANIVKLERPIRYESYLDKEYEKLYQLRGSYESGLLSEEELKARVEIEYDRINELLALCNNEKVVTGFYYLVLFESDKRQLEMQVSNALSNLQQGELSVHRLNDKELAVFLKYSNALDFDENEIDKIAPADYAQWAKPDVVDITSRRVEVNHVITHNFRVVNYPALVGDAWLAGVMSIPGTKVVVKARPMDRTKAIRGIDRSLMELRGQWSATGVDSKRLEIEQHLSTLQELLNTLQADNESLLECNVYITAYDIVGTRNNYKIKQPGESMLPTIADMKKTIRRAWQESSFRLNNMEFEQVQAFIASQVSGLDPLALQGRGIPSNTVAACYPWIFAHISDEGGVKLGANDGIPVFINFFRRDSERVNSNMVIVGKSGSGKSYATKSILSNLAADDAKIFILDPENEYQELAGNLHGKIINVGNAQYGRLNPFHIITALDDDEAGESGPSGSYATHLQFLEEFFRQILPDCEKDAMEYLNTLLDRLYGDFNITGETDLSKLTPEDYPIFDDLYDAILQEFQSTDNDYIRTMLRTLMNYVAKFSTGGRNANIWNGPSTVTTDTNFTVFNFQSMLANRNQTVANAQMLLVLKYIDNEIIKNRDYNMKYGLKRKVVVVIDEAHVFIDAKYPIALDFMFQLAKRIRKYNGMQIVITQNIKDFVGSEEIARKSTAIINACQYSFIFALAPNDIQDLVKLYENAGGINETEQEQIVQAPRGQAFTIMSPTSRSTFRVETGESMIHMFEDREYVSAYFNSKSGEQNWEDFVADSREAHDEAVASRREQEKEAEETVAVSRQSVMFEEIDAADYEAAPTKSGGISFEEETDEAPTKSGGIVFEEETDEAPTKSGGISFEEETDEAPEKSGGISFEEEFDETPHMEAEEIESFVAFESARPKRRAASVPSITGDSAGGAEQGPAMNAVMGMFGTMVGQMTEAFQRMGGGAPDPVLTAQLAAKDAQISAKDAELERIRMELEQLKQSLGQGGVIAFAAGARPAAASQTDSISESGDEIDWNADDGESTEIDWNADDSPTTEIDWNADDSPTTEIDWNEDDSPTTEIDWNADDGESGKIDWGEDKDAGDEIDWGADLGTEGTESTESEGSTEGSEEDLFDLTSFLARSVERAQSLTFVERMRRDGMETSEITISELVEYLQQRKEQAKDIA